MPKRVPSAREFVELALKRIGHGNKTRLGEALGLGGNSYKRVHTWTTTDSEPTYTETMAMLAKLGWLNITADDPSAAESPDDRLEEIAEAGVDVLAGLERLLEGQQKIRTELEQLGKKIDAAAAPPKRQEGGGSAR